MKHLRTNQNGFTLAEVLVALTILAVGLLSIAGMQITAIKTNSSANSLAVVTSLADGVMEEILALSPTDPVGRTAVVNQPWPNLNNVTIAGAGTYSATYTVAVNDPVANVSRVTVVVTGGGPVGSASRRSFQMVGFKRTTAW